MTKYYWSTDSILDAGDTYLDSRSIPSLAAGASSTGSIAVTVPSGLATGTYYIIAMADADNVVSEINEVNNTRVRAVTVK